MSKALKIRHELGDVTFTPAGRVASARLKSVLRRALDDYALAERVPAAAVHAEIRELDPGRYGTPGYFLNLYRLRSEITQAELARRAGMRQHHVSEIEHNRRPMGKALARKLAAILGCDYRRLL